jgi:hypothetical protein
VAPLFAKFLLLALSLSAQANDTFSLDRDASGRLILSAPSCAEAKSTAEAIRTWTSNLGQSPAAAPAPAQSGSRCSLDATALLPDFVRARQDKGTAVNGPNCWNTTLMTFGMARAQRFSIASEMTFWMSSPYCRELADGEDPAPGDALALRTSSSSPDSFEEMHGMIHLTPEVVWSKNTSTSDDPYRIQRVDLIYQNFHTYACFKVNGIPSECNNWVNVFRCTDPSADRSAARSADPALDSVSKKLEALEDSISRAAVNGSSLDLKAATAALDEMEPGVKAAIAAGTSPSLFFWRALEQEILSLRSQLNLLQKKR